MVYDARNSPGAGRYPAREARAPAPPENRILRLSRAKSSEDDCGPPSCAARAPRLGHCGDRPGSVVFLRWSGVFDNTAHAVSESSSDDLRRLSQGIPFPGGARIAPPSRGQQLGPLGHRAPAVRQVTTIHPLDFPKTPFPVRVRLGRVRVLAVETGNRPGPFEPIEAECQRQ